MAEKRDRCKQLADDFGCIGKWSFGNGYYSSFDGDYDIFVHHEENIEYRDYCFTRCRYSFQCWETFLAENDFSYDDEIDIENVSFKHYLRGIRFSISKFSH